MHTSSVVLLVGALDDDATLAEVLGGGSEGGSGEGSDALEIVVVVLALGDGDGDVDEIHVAILGQDAAVGVGQLCLDDIDRVACVFAGVGDADRTIRDDNLRVGVGSVVSFVQITVGEGVRSSDAFRAIGVDLKRVQRLFALAQRELPYALLQRLIIVAHVGNLRIVDVRSGDHSLCTAGSEEFEAEEA